MQPKGITGHIFCDLETKRRTQLTAAFNECFQTDADSGYWIIQLMRNKSDDIILESADLIFIGDVADKDRQSVEHMMVIAAKMNCQS